MVGMAILTMVGRKWSVVAFITANKVLAPNGVVMVGMAILTMVGRKWSAMAFITANESLKLAPFVDWNKMELHCFKIAGKLPHIS